MRRYQILLAAPAASHIEIVDELVRRFDQALVGADGRARDRLAARQAELVAADVGRLMLLDEMLDVVLGTDRDDLDAAAEGQSAARRESAALPEARVASIQRRCSNVVGLQCDGLKRTCGSSGEKFCSSRA